ncbi:uncharacterized protein BX664DRAFT_268262 [Halteromyces radiatus]|uniref:uncharacterized protein n=1 Tax=Halteromyces radiatus TaxID=101107 RepID=UPI00221EB0A9|nr:uncharacterized protein BX664DRAFT_268262 [Halteromyces radiatus]KAI8081564.1 hypothetical protein BX664DRAFT_268262 [Halteromyces radiatus]
MTTNNTNNTTSVPTSAASSPTRKPTSRKKKAARACIHCQKAHLTCDDARPCQRCTKRGLASTCTDGARKKAKYLQDTEESTGTPTTPTSLSNLWQASATAAGLSSSIIQPDNQQNMKSLPFNNTTNHGMETRPSIQHPSTSASSPSASGLDTVLYSPDQNTIGSPYNPSTPTSQTSNNVRISSLSAYGEGAVVAKVDSPNTALAQVKRRNQLVTPEMVYARATKPFSYADGYHYLINYVRQKMSRKDLMRISRALALFRPSVLASMMNLTEDDLVFTEKCLQRTLLEYEKLISYSGTPTVVWRRTGEITLVGKEFSLLTQWSRDALLGKKTYIYELMSNPSAIEYWEKYSSHAFDNTDSAVYSSCILLSPTKRVVPCTFCFTIKRDIFDLPSVIVGNVSDHS